MAVSHRCGFLDQAILNGRLQQLRYIFKESDSLRGVRTREGLSPLVLALNIDDDRIRRKIFNFLLSRGAEVSEKDAKFKRDALTWACYLGRADQVNRLLDYAPGDFHLSQPDVEGMLPIHYAVRSGNPLCVFRVVKEMKKYRISVDVPGSDGLTPFLDAKRLGFELIAQILVKEGGASPTQFDTRRFRTKTRWSEAGQSQREEEICKKALEEMRIVGSLRPHTSYQKRREKSAIWRTAALSRQSTSWLQRGNTSTSFCSNSSNVGSRPKTSPVLADAKQDEEMYTDLQIKDLQNIVDGKLSVDDIRREKGRQAEEEDADNQIVGRQLMTNRRSQERVHVWPKLSFLMSLSEKASTLPADVFTSSVPNDSGHGMKTEAGTKQFTAQSNKATHAQSSHSVMLTSMLTSLSQQMSPAFRKAVVPKTTPVITTTSTSRRRKKDSTLAFILRTSSRKAQRKVQCPNPNTVRLKTSSQLGRKANKTAIETKQTTAYRKRLANESNIRSTKINMNSKSGQLPMVGVR